VRKVMSQVPMMDRCCCITIKRSKGLFYFLRVGGGMKKERVSTGSEAGSLRHKKTGQADLSGFEECGVIDDYIMPPMPPIPPPWS